MSEVVVCGYQVDRRMPPMVAELRKGVREGWKTQSRRVMRPQPKKVYPEGFRWNGFCDMANWYPFCPIGRVGDIAVMTEPLCKGESGLVVYRDDSWERRVLSKPPRGGVPWEWKTSVLSSMFMPVWAGRTVVRYVRVSAERLQDISEGDAAAEGVAPVAGSYVPGFLQLWDGMCKPETSSKEDPWVWVLEWELLVVDGKEVKSE